MVAPSTRGPGPWLCPGPVCKPSTALDEQALGKQALEEQAQTQTCTVKNSGVSECTWAYERVVK